jgi:cytochrome c-type biogenesis protein CcmH/NrfF
MVGIGISELLILVVVLSLMVIPAVIVIVVIYFVMRAQRQSAVQSSNLMRCPDCNLEVSRSAKACPHCGRPTATLG